MVMTGRGSLPIRPVQHTHTHTSACVPAILFIYKYVSPLLIWQVNSGKREKKSACRCVAAAAACCCWCKGVATGAHAKFEWEKQQQRTIDLYRQWQQQQSTDDVELWKGERRRERERRVEEEIITIVSLLLLLLLLLLYYLVSRATTSCFLNNRLVTRGDGNVRDVKYEALDKWNLKRKRKENMKWGDSPVTSVNFL